MSHDKNPGKGNRNGNRRYLAILRTRAIRWIERMNSWLKDAAQNFAEKKMPDWQTY